MLSVTCVGVSAQAQAPQARTSASDVSAKGTVLQSTFGKAQSRVKGTFANGGVVSGKFVPRRFVVRNGQLAAVGTLTATLTKASGKVVGTDTKRVTLPVASMEGVPMTAGAAARAGSCDILNLVLGPLDLNLLGLEVHLDKVVLDIVATPGPGNLLGNLLCAVAGLLDQTGLLTQVQQLLNSILAILRL
jgi:hypothetical protein